MASILPQGNALQMRCQPKSRQTHPFLLERAANVAFSAGADQLGLDFVNRAFAANPNGPKLRARAADYFLAAAGRAADAGEVEVARDRYLRALELEPDLDEARQALADL